MIAKFRAWDKENKRWMTPEIENGEESEIRLGLWGHIYFRKPWFEQEPGTITIVSGKNMFDLSQSTGLKDKNGVEIYEGDYLFWTSFESQTELKGEIVFYKGSFCMVVRIKGHDYKLPLHELSDSDDLMEVLGNIYENPELLEVAE